MRYGQLQNMLPTLAHHMIGTHRQAAEKKPSYRSNIVDLIIPTRCISIATKILFALANF